ncbi:unnamed protein product [Symbiodinium sp. CCMP2592]|nr:unnamed protein product [Symbiodinium sp. CCMP2592]
MASKDGFAKESSGYTYGTLLGVRYKKDTGVKQLFYSALIALGLTVVRIVADLALALSLRYKDTWALIFMSLLDLALSIFAGVAARCAVTSPSWNTVVFAAVSFLEAALFSTIYLVVVIVEVCRAWEECPTAAGCSDVDAAIASHGVLLIILAAHLSLPITLIQLLGAYLAAHLPQYVE